MIPEASPAATVVGRVTTTVVLTTLSATATSTDAPASTDSVLAATSATIVAPTTVPGILPTISQPTPCQSTWARSPMAMPVARGSASMVVAAGTAAGSNRATTGTASRLDPKPSVPCTAAPTVTAASTARYSTAPRWMLTPERRSARRSGRARAAPCPGGRRAARTRSR